MITALAKIALGPILLAQGAHVRRVTPRLPEPDGERAGVCGNGDVLRLLILGDSAAAGVGAATQANGLTGQLVSRLAHDFHVSWKLLARSGFNTNDVLSMLECSPAERFDVALVSVGVNDVTGRVSAKRWLASLERLVGVLKEKFGTGYILLSRLPPMHLFPALPQPLRWYLGARAHRFNTHLANLVQDREDCVLLAPEFSLSAESMAADGFHPGPPSYTTWAKAAAELIRRYPAATSRSLVP
jgi:lysophospholipase L1-like esterase